MKISSAEKTVIFCLVILISSVAVLIFVKNTSYFKINDVEINYSDNVQGTVEDFESLKSRLNQINLFKVSVKSLKSQFNSFPYIKSAEIKRYFPDKLKIDLVFNDYLFKCRADDRFLLSDGKTVVECSYEIASLYSEIKSVVLDSEYFDSVVALGCDEGFVQMAVLVDSVNSNNLISSIKYDNNNLSDFGRLTLKLDCQGVVLKVMEPVEPSRLSEVLDIVDRGTYELYSSTLVKRNQEDYVGIR